MEQYKTWLDEVVHDVEKKKVALGVAAGFSEGTMNRFLLDKDFRHSNECSEIRGLKLGWFRKRKNADIKDKFTIKGIERGYQVHAEKTMGAQPELQSKKHQRAFNMFDLCWLDKTASVSCNQASSLEFPFAMEIEMDIDPKSVVQDLKKLCRNSRVKDAIVVCQEKTSKGVEVMRDQVFKEISLKNQGGTKFLVSIWNWEKHKFDHFSKDVL